MASNIRVAVRVRPSHSLPAPGDRDYDRKYSIALYVARGGL